MPHLTAIVAMDPNRLIGANGALPWHLPEDLKFFKRTTLGHPVLMGRKTFESIGKPLPGRSNIVLTRDRNWSHEGVALIHEPVEIEKMAGRIFIIGGAEVYKAFSGKIDEWLVSHVNQAYEGDTYLAEFEEGYPDVRIVEEHPDFTVRRYRR